VKHAISLFRGRDLNRKCGDWVTSKKCKLHHKTKLVLKQLDARLIEAIAQDEYNWKAANTLTANLKHEFRAVFYEDLMGFNDEVENLLWWLGFNISEFGYADEFIGRCTSNCTKNTSDDLRDSIANYEEVESWIDSRYPCLSSQFHETRPGKVQPFVNNICGDLFRSRVDAYLERSSHEI